MNANHLNHPHIRKGRWSEDECMRFERAYLDHENNWKAITTAVGTRTIVQVRTHAQKVVPRLIKDGPKYLPTESASDQNRPSQQEGSSLNHRQSSLYESWLYHTLTANYLFNAIREYSENTKRSNSDDQTQKEVGAKTDDRNEVIA